MFDLIRETGPLSEALDSLSWNGASKAAFPAMDLWEDEKAITVRADVPGFKLEDIEVTVLDKQITLRGERKAPAPEGVTVHHRERASGSFLRTVILAAPADPERVQATLEDGVLTVTLPKPAVATPKKIAVQRPG